ncbi:MAG: hypothetical protein H7175_10795 [Burkholderiales bacterium]|nr:hypothetical protein [Anaerolineae bacterium]
MAPRCVWALEHGLQLISDHVIADCGYAAQALVDLITEDGKVAIIPPH